MVLTFSLELHCSPLLMFEAPCRRCCLTLELGSEVPLMCCWHQPGSGERTNSYSLKNRAFEEAKIYVIALLHTMWGHVGHVKPDYFKSQINACSCKYWKSEETQQQLCHSGFMGFYLFPASNNCSLFCTEISSLCQLHLKFCCFTLTWLIEKVTFSYIIIWTIHKSRKLVILWVFATTFMYYMPNSIIDPRASENSNIYFKSIKSYINLLSPSHWNRHLSLYLLNLFWFIK